MNELLKKSVPVHYGCETLCVGLFDEHRVRNVTCVFYPKTSNGGALAAGGVVTNRSTHIFRGFYLHLLNWTHLLVKCTYKGYINCTP